MYANVVAAFRPVRVPPDYFVCSFSTARLPLRICRPLPSQPELFDHEALKARSYSHIKLGWANQTIPRWHRYKRICNASAGGSLGATEGGSTRASSQRSTDSRLSSYGHTATLGCYTAPDFSPDVCPSYKHTVVLRMSSLPANEFVARFLRGNRTSFPSSGRFCLSSAVST